MQLSHLVAVEHGLGVAVHGGQLHLVHLPLLAYHEALPEEKEVGEHHRHQDVAVAGEVEHQGLHLVTVLQCDGVTMLQLETLDQTSG